MECLALSNTPSAHPVFLVDAQIIVLQLLQMLAHFFNRPKRFRII